MTNHDTTNYIRHHLTLAGRSDTLFSDDAVARIHQTSRGYPRAVNNLAVQALIAAFAADKIHRRRKSRPHRRHRGHRRMTPPPALTPRPRQDTPGGAFPCTRVLTANDAAIITPNVRAHTRQPLPTMWPSA